MASLYHGESAVKVNGSTQAKWPPNAEEMPVAQQGKPINVKSDHLVVLVATYNRLPMLERTLAAIAATTRCDHEVIVIDGGSTDGTIEYLQAHSDVAPVFQGRLLGSARCYNTVWRSVDSAFTCWLSDDTEVTSGALDNAVTALERDRRIGMVGLKMLDTAGAGAAQAFMGGISEYGVLTCNHGVLRTSLLRDVGYFNEAYHSYTIDPDLTASVLCAGRKVVMTKKIAVLHHRAWVESEPVERMQSSMKGIDNWAIYREKFRFLAAVPSGWQNRRHRASRLAQKFLFRNAGPHASRFGFTSREFDVYAQARFVKLSDRLTTIGKTYHLVQDIPQQLLVQKENPYRHLLDSLPQERLSPRKMGASSTSGRR